MSLLPTTLQPPGDPIGRVNEAGEVIAEKNFWLLLYNICQNVLGIGATGGSPASLPSSALTELASLDADATDSDAIALRSPIANLQKQQDFEATIFGADIASVSRKADNALLFAQDLLLSDISATPGLANPSGTVGLSAVNGSATTAIRSDGAPALSQAITPTWTGQHIFTPGTSTTAIIVNTTVNNVGVSVRSGSGSGAIIETCGDGSGTGNGLSLTQTSVGAGVINLNFNAALSFKVNGTTRLTIGSDGSLTAPGTINFSGGPTITLVTANGTGSGAGGLITVTAGNGGSTSGTGGNVQVSAGAGGSPNGAGGSFVFFGGASSGTGTGGHFSLNGGNANGTGIGGAITLTAGEGNGLYPGAILKLTGGAASAGTAADCIFDGAQGADAAHSGNIIFQDFAADNTFIVDPFGNVVAGCISTTATSDTDGFFYVPKVAGAPTGVPGHLTGNYATSLPMRYDTSNHKLWVYDGAWKGVVLS